MWPQKSCTAATPGPDAEQDTPFSVLVLQCLARAWIAISGQSFENLECQQYCLKDEGLYVVVIVLVLTMANIWTPTVRLAADIGCCVSLHILQQNKSTDPAL